MKLSAVTDKQAPKDYNRGTLSKTQIESIILLNDWTATILTSNGQSRYVIQLDKEHGSAVTCSCPIYSNNPIKACKHMLAVDNRNSLQRKAERLALLQGLYA